MRPIASSSASAHCPEHFYSLRECLGSLKPSAFHNISGSEPTRSSMHLTTKGRILRASQFRSIDFAQYVSSRRGQVRFVATGPRMSIERDFERHADRIFKSIGRHRGWSLSLGLGGYLLLFGVGICGLYLGWGAADKIWLVLKGFYGLLTIGAPFFFFCEYLAQSEPRPNEAAADRSARLRELKNMHDQGRAVWLACATVVGLLLFKGP